MSEVDPWFLAEAVAYPAAPMELPICISPTTAFLVLAAVALLLAELVVEALRDPRRRR